MNNVPRKKEVLKSCEKSRLGVVPFGFGSMHQAFLGNYEEIFSFELCKFVTMANILRVKIFAVTTPFKCQVVENNPKVRISKLIFLI